MGWKARLLMTLVLALSAGLVTGLTYPAVHQVTGVGLGQLFLFMVGVIGLVRFLKE